MTEGNSEPTEIPGRELSSPNDQEILRAEGIWKSFGSVEALRGVSFSLQQREIRGLLGENGAGKSVLLKILGGVIKPDKGRIFWKGKEVRFNSPLDAQNHGYFIVHQDTNLIPSRSVVENIYLGLEKEVSKRLLLNRDEMRKRSEECMQRFFGMSIDPDKPVRELDAVDQKLVEATRALNQKAEVIVFDETTAQMTTREKTLLFQHIKSLSRGGVGVIFVSHIMPEVFELCNTVTVLRDGKDVATKHVQETSVEDLTMMMTGKDRGMRYPPKSTPRETILLSVKNLRSENVVEDISFDLYEGEVLGVVGIRNEGQRELLRTIAGIVPKRAGTIEVSGKELRPGILNAIRSGVVYLSDQREIEGIFLARPVSDNIVIQNLKDVVRNGLVDTNLENRTTEEAISKYRIRGAGPAALASSLSGGNRQKVLLARLGLSGAKVFLLSDPARGIDVGAKEEVYAVIAELSREGKGILIISEDITHEVMGLCHRVLIVYEGRLKNVLPVRKENLDKILEQVYAVEHVDK